MVWTMPNNGSTTTTTN